MHVSLSNAGMCFVLGFPIVIVSMVETVEQDAQIDVVNIG